nr:IS5 family transposase [Methylorubrum extorquens]
MAKFLVPDDLWVVIAPLMSPARARPKGGRPPIPDRAALTGILFVLRTGLPWEYLPQEMGCGSGMSCWRRLRDWQRAGVWASLHRALLKRLDGAGQLDWSRAALDSASLPAKKGGRPTGPNPTDRGKPGTKRHLVVDARGTPLGVVLSGANTHDSTGPGRLVREAAARRARSLRRARSARADGTEGRAPIRTRRAGRHGPARADHQRPAARRPGPCGGAAPGGLVGRGGPGRQGLWLALERARRAAGRPSHTRRLRA